MANTEERGLPIATPKMSINKSPENMYNYCQHWAELVRRMNQQKWVTAKQ